MAKFRVAPIVLYNDGVYGLASVAPLVCSLLNPPPPSWGHKFCSIVLDSMHGGPQSHAHTPTQPQLRPQSHRRTRKHRCDDITNVYIGATEILNHILTKIHSTRHKTFRFKTQFCRSPFLHYDFMGSHFMRHIRPHKIKFNTHIFNGMHRRSIFGWRDRQLAGGMRERCTRG